MTRTDLVGSVARFASEAGGDVEGIWSAPGRVNLIGEHTDYNEGFVLPFAIEQRTAVAAVKRGDSTVTVRSKQSEGIVEIDLRTLQANHLKGWSSYPLGVVWAFGDAGVNLADVTGLDLFIDSEVPLGAGLSSSAAIECAVAVALQDLWGTNFSRAELARICQRAENIAVGAPTGIMDQSVSMMGEAGNALFLDCRSLDTQAVPFDLEAEGLALLVMDTGVKHEHSTGGYASRRASCEEASAQLGVAALRDATLDQLSGYRNLSPETVSRARHIITENERVKETVRVLEHKGPRAIGDLLVASHVSMRDDFDISCDELNLAVDTALAHGALGARMTGGGFGGAAIALVEVATINAIIRAVEDAFVAAGFLTPRCFTVTPSTGAAKEQI